MSVPAAPFERPQPVVDSPEGELDLPESLGYRIKNRLLGPPLVSEQLGEQRLGKVAALGVLAPDCISSTAYGSEEMLRILVPAVGVAAFSLLLPVTLAILAVLFFVTLSYRQVVVTYTQAGGSYVVGRENFGPRVAQVAAAALTIDYTVTVAVQVAAGTAAVDSAVPSLVPYTVPICVGVVLLMIYGNLRGIREASKLFALPTYLFVFSMGLLVVVGVARAALGQLHTRSIDVAGAVQAGRPGSGLLMGATIFILLRSFANGGSSLTGLEAISNGVGAFRPPEGRNARRTLVVMSTILGSLVLGVSLLARITHAVPYAAGSPTLVAQEAKDVFGHGVVGGLLYGLVIIANVTILYTGGNTSFSGFPFLASFVARDSFLPRWLTKRGHRLAFSNGIIVLGVVAILLLVVSRAQVDSLVSIYAIGVFTGFTMAGAGMVHHFRRVRTTHWQRRALVSGFSAILTAIVVLTFAITKFNQGAWVVVVLLPLLAFGFIRINTQYLREENVLETDAVPAASAPVLRRHVVLILVDQLDLATARTIQYARILTPDAIRLAHFRIDVRRARELEDAWSRVGLSNLPLEILDCPDRRLGRAAVMLAASLLDGETEVSVLLPRRDFARVWSRVLHDRTAERIALLVDELPNVNATIVPYELTRGRVQGRLPEPKRKSSAAGPRHGLRGDAMPAPGLPVEDGSGSPPGDAVGAGVAQLALQRSGPDAARPPRQRGGRHGLPLSAGHAPAAPPGTIPIASVRPRQRARVAGQVKSVEIQPRGGIQVLAAALEDSTGRITLVWGRRRVDGIEVSARLIVEGMVGEYDGRLAMRNPYFEFLAPPTSETD